MRRIQMTSVLMLASMLSWHAARSHDITSRIVIAGDFLAAPIEITDPDIARKFNVWNGPGVGIRDLERPPDLPLYVESEGAGGRFIDWPKGIATVRPSGLQRVEVTFFMSEHHNYMPYVVVYEIDATHNIGYIYLPRWKNSHMIWHGAEGYWYHAHARWNELIMPIVLKDSAAAAFGAERAELPCKLGVGTIQENGSVEIYPLDKDGNYSTRWNYDTTDDEYESVRLLFDEAETGVEIDLSCWPPRN